MSQVFQEANNWSKILKVTTIGEMNDKICNGMFNEVIRISEALHEKKIAYIADEINKGHRRIVLVAGPSSSGKTTFSERLCIQMRVNGLHPYLVSLDNYFFNRCDAPIGSDGRPDLENFKFMDAGQLNKDLTGLLNGEEVEIPFYNFHTGKREFRGKRMKLEKGDVLVLEGIHALNEALTYSVPVSKKFKIFISALTQLNMDDHNRIPTSDTRLLRRIVRDNQFRGTDAATTIAQWPSVVRGADTYIFPFQEQADAFFNSALIYEMSVLKQYAEPLLFRIEKSSPEYADARRLIKFLDAFIAGSDKNVNINSILREFIGGSCFDT
jgi:uridine kinase